MRAESRKTKQIVLTSLSLAIGLIILAQPGVAAMSIAGVTGLVGIPTARIMPDGKVAFGVGYTDREYGWYAPKYDQVAYYVTVGYLPFLEASVRVTTFPGSSPAGTHGWDKDRMVSVGLRVMDERRYMPSILIGGRDIFGETVRFNALYVVMSRAVRLPIVGVLDVHLGCASDLMKELLLNSDLLSHSMTGAFAGLEMRLCRYLAVMGEYDTRKCNVGLRIMPWGERANIDLAALGLKHISGGMSISFNL